MAAFSLLSELISYASCEPDALISVLQTHVGYTTYCLCVHVTTVKLSVFLCVHHSLCHWSLYHSFSLFLLLPTSPLPFPFGSFISTVCLPLPSLPPPPVPSPSFPSASVSRLSWSTLVDPVIDRAYYGFEVTEHLANALKQVEDEPTLNANKLFNDTFRPEGQMAKVIVFIT